ncbi:MAG: hypothetical protein ACREIT_03795 [Tepidisphaeraceae bacterium]
MPPTRTFAGRYASLTLVGLILRGFGYAIIVLGAVFLVVGVVAYFTSARGSWIKVMPAALSFLGMFWAGLITVAAGEFLHAVRDIAVNSFRTAQALAPPAQQRETAPGFPVIVDDTGDAETEDAGISGVATTPPVAPAAAPAAQHSAPPVTTANAQSGGLPVSRIVELLEDLREVSLMNDTQRQARLQQMRERHRDAAAAQVQRLVAERHWRRAAEGVAALEKDFPGDPAVIRLRTQLDQKRSDAERGGVAELRQKVDGLMAVSSFDEAMTSIDAFLHAFPESVEGQLLHDRVRRERDAFAESTTLRLFDEIKHASERRDWRKAHATASRLLERFPNHARSQGIRQQLDTLRENADVQERKEHEAKVQQLVRSRRFADAVTEAEELVRRFPDSRQAETMNELLPRLREMAEQAEAGTAGS